MQILEGVSTLGTKVWENNTIKTAWNRKKKKFKKGEKRELTNSRRAQREQGHSKISWCLLFPTVQREIWKWFKQRKRWAGKSPCPVLTLGPSSWTPKKHPVIWTCTTIGFRQWNLSLRTQHSHIPSTKLCQHLLVLQGSSWTCANVILLKPSGCLGPGCLQQHTSVRNLQIKIKLKCNFQVFWEKVFSSACG